MVVVDIIFNLLFVLGFGLGNKLSSVSKLYLQMNHFSVGTFYIMIYRASFMNFTDFQNFSVSVDIYRGWLWSLGDDFKKVFISGRNDFS